MLPGLVGNLGVKISQKIPKDINREKIPDIADTVLNDRDLFDDLFSLVGKNLLDTFF